ncbi:hypothetical protein F66182_704 [Fusarium sp. NRRL 66182]|nr:hypothetical protein F66182_704 [Fusarium sp. NRRL 66182]
MFRLQPAAITLTAREISDAERRSRYRKHLIERQRRIARRRRGVVSPDQDVSLQDALNTRLEALDAESLRGIDMSSPDSDTEYSPGDDDEPESPEPSPNIEDDTSSEFVPVTNDDNAINPSRGSERHGLVYHQRPDLTVGRDLEIGPFSFHARPGDQVDESTEQDVDGPNSWEPLLTAAVMIDYPFKNSPRHPDNYRKPVTKADLTAPTQHPYEDDGGEPKQMAHWSREVGLALDVGVMSAQ